MREDSMNKFRGWLVALIQIGALLLFAVAVFAQETTAGLQGTVKDPSGAVVANATVTVTSGALVGEKSAKTDGNGYYRFANLPPGSYSVTVKAEGFATYKREGLVLELGRLPSVDIALQVGKTETVVEVSGAAPLVDVTSSTNQTNVTEDMISNAPHGYSFQSMIQFAPMARNEPLAGSQLIGGGTGGGALPGSSGNGNSIGYSIGGAADSESAYLVEGQDTENISAGYSNANVPFEFIQEVQIKTSGIEAEHGGALGGVINVIMKKGSNGYHGSGFLTYGGDALNGSPNNTLRYDPLGNLGPDGEDASQEYTRRKDGLRTLQPGFTFGGPIKKDRLWFFMGFAPFLDSISRSINFNPSICSDPAVAPQCINTALGKHTFKQEDKLYYTTARLDASLTQKIRVFGSWLYQYERLNGNSLPIRDPQPGQNLLNTSITVLDPLAQYSHAYGYSQPNSTYNVGADITINPKVVSTTRFGYFFTNYHDFGWPTTAADLSWDASGIGGSDNGGSPLPSGLQQSVGFATAPYDQSYTLVNASKHYQFNQDVAFFKSGWGGTHNFKFGYQLNRLSNVVNQNGNVPFVDVFPGSQQSYSASTTNGGTNCGLLIAEWGNCAGQYGYVTITDFATILPKPAIDWNHAFFAQDSWTVGRGLTLNLGIRVEKENLPVPSGLQQPGVVPPASINFPWSDKIEPRLGFAWGPASGKMKVFGSYGVVNDVMKLLLAQTSWGAQAFEQCTYPLGPNSSSGFTNSDISVAFANNRACPNGPPTQGANFVGGTTPPPSMTDAGTGISLIENVNLRPWEPVAHGVKPYRQHEAVFGIDYQIAKDWAFEARWDRRRLDHVIEDASLADPTNFEMYTIVNPGEGVNRTIDGYANYLGSLGSAYGIPNFAFDPSGFGTCPSCPPIQKAIRNYDGVELRLTKGTSHGWAGSFSYTYSSLRGNYTGLTTTDQSDGGIVGRASPDTTRSFDEPFTFFNTQGDSSNGPLPTDRPSAFKGNVYYELHWMGGTTTFGLFQAAYQGTPVTAYSDLGLACCNEPIEAAYIFGRGKWANFNTDSAGNVTIGAPYTRRTPWFTQTDFNLSHSIKVNKNNEHQVLTFQATAINLLNQHSVVAYWQGANSIYNSSSLFPFEVFTGAAFYQTVEKGYDPQNEINAQANGTCVFCQIFGQPLPFIKNSQYGQPNLWQLSRNIRLGVSFSF